MVSCACTPSRREIISVVVQPTIFDEGRSTGRTDRLIKRLPTNAGTRHRIASTPQIAMVQSSGAAGRGAKRDAIPISVGVRNKIVLVVGVAVGNALADRRRRPCRCRDWVRIETYKRGKRAIRKRDVGRAGAEQINASIGRDATTLDDAIQMCCVSRKPASEEFHVMDRRRGTTVPGPIDDITGLS